MNRVEMIAGEPVLKTGVRLAEVLARLEAGGALDRVRDALSLDTADVISALVFAALGAEDDLGPPLVQAAPHYSWAAEAASENSLAKLFPNAPRPALLALSAGLLQIHDVWDASHEAASQADDLGEHKVSAYWHGIAHRREPDAGNSAYWFRQVGPHAIFRPLWEAAQPLLAAHGDRSLTDRLGAGGTWNPQAMIDLCTTAPHATPTEQLARRLQRLEMLTLLDPSFAQASG